MRTIALACLLLAPAQDIPTFTGEGPASGPAPKITLRAIVDDPAPFTADPTLILDGVRVSSCQKLELPGHTEGYYVVTIYEPATGEIARPSATSRLIFGINADSVADVIRSRPELEKLEARVRFFFSAEPAPSYDPARPIYVAIVSSIEWLDERGEIVATAR